MRRAAWVPLAVLALFLAEAVTFIGLGDLVGYGWAVLVVVLVSVIGLVLVRREGTRAWRGFRQAMAAGEPPGRRIIDGLVGLAGALLLAVPGLLTGAAGLVLLAPPVRALAAHRMRSSIEHRIPPAEAGDVFGPRRVKVWQEGPEPPDGPIVEGEVVDPTRRRGDTGG